MSNRSREKNWIDDLAAKFPNGRHDLAKCADVSINQVGNWKAAGFIPSPRIFLILKSAPGFGVHLAFSDCFPPLNISYQAA